MKKAFSAIDLLIALVIMAAIFLIGTNAFNGISSIKINGKSDVKSIQQQVDEQVNEIENMRMQTINMKKQQLEENNY